MCTQIPTCHHPYSHVHKLPCAQTHTLTHPPPMHTHQAHTHSSLCSPSRWPALPAGGTSWPPAPSSILPASPSLASPYPSHLLISLLNSRRRRGSCGRGEMDGPAGVEGRGARPLSARNHALPAQAGVGSVGLRSARPPSPFCLPWTAWPGPRDPSGSPWHTPAPGHLLPVCRHRDLRARVERALSSCTPCPALTPLSSPELITRLETHPGLCAHHIQILPGQPRHWFSETPVHTQHLGRAYTWAPTHVCTYWAHTSALLADPLAAGVWEVGDPPLVMASGSPSAGPRTASLRGSPTG